MNRNPYLAKQSPRTRILNFFRLPFTWNPLEKLLLLLLKTNRTFWEKAIPSPYLYKKPSIRKVRRWGGILFELDLSNKNDHQVYFYTPPGHFMKTLTQLRSESGICIDIGANIGYSALLFAREMPDARIHAFEPHPVTYTKACNNIALNNEFRDRIQIHNFGLGKEESSAKLYQVSHYNLGMNRIHARNVHQHKFPSTTIQIRSLDQFMNVLNASHVCLIKIDVEGFEMEVLQGALRTIQQFKPPLLIEICDRLLKDSGHSAIELVDFLQKLDYEITDLKDDKKITAASPRLNDCYMDALCFQTNRE